MSQAALIVIDVQQGFRDRTHWGPRNNPDAEANIERLIDRWRGAQRPVVLVRHDSTEPQSPLRAGQPGNDFEPFVHGDHSLLVTKTVNSAFYGDPDLHAWLQSENIDQLVICGITTNHCCETTARMAGNLGYDVTFVLDATYTNDRDSLDGVTISADELSRTTAANLAGEFATVAMTDTVVAF